MICDSFIVVEELAAHWLSELEASWAETEMLSEEERDKVQHDQKARMAAAERASVLAAEEAKRQFALRLAEVAQMKEHVVSEAKSRINASDVAFETAAHTVQIRSAEPQTFHNTTTTFKKADSKFKQR